MDAQLSLNNDGELQISDSLHCYKYNRNKDTFEKRNTRFIDERPGYYSRLQQELGNVFPGVNVFSYCKSKQKDELWVATLNHGLYKIAHNQYISATNYKNKQGDERSLSCNEVYCVFVDKSGNIWAGTKDGGLNKGIVNKTSFKKLVHNKNPLNGFPEGSIRAIHKEKNGRLWVGTYNSGVYVVDQKSRRIKFSKNPETDKWDWIRSIAQTRDGFIWVGSYAGLCRVDPSTFKLTYYAPGAADSQSISSARIYSMAEDNKGNLFIGEWGSLEYFNRETNAFKRIDVHNDFKNKNIRKVLLSQNGNLWVGTESAGIFVIDTSNYSVIKHYQSKPGAAGSINSNSIFEMYEDANGTVWVGNFGGINCIDKNGNVDKLLWINEKRLSTLIYKILKTIKTTFGVVHQKALPG
ncbi:MAG: hypothetical protein HC831_07395 [Chloroflexia bacterium]|nr:hypothetical protein [Chloroflexia bacterium]